MPPSQTTCSMTLVQPLSVSRLSCTLFLDVLLQLSRLVFRRFDIQGLFTLLYVGYWLNIYICLRVGMGNSIQLLHARSTLIISVPGCWWRRCCAYIRVQYMCIKVMVLFARPHCSVSSRMWEERTHIEWNCQCSYCAASMVHYRCSWSWCRILGKGGFVHLHIGNLAVHNAELLTKLRKVHPLVPTVFSVLIL